jgi:serine/threonine protein kinase
MQRQELLQQLGLTPAASSTDIRDAITAKREQLQSKAASAPTDALKTKYQALLDQLVQAEKVLLEPAAKSRFSQTQLDDMPQSATQFEGGNQAQMNIAVGTVLANRYEIKEQIGAGGMGAVYRANDKNTGDDIALKILLPALMQNERARERFLNEARISQKLSHPNIVNVFDVQQDGDLFFLTMELLQGQDLRQAMDNRKLARQAFAVDEVIDIANAISTGLTYAHKYTIHRDIKPENIWLADNGDIKIMDFGIAQVQSTSQRTKTGAAMGTAYYMAPEQLKGAKDIDGRADQYALAVMVYELLSGEVPAGMIEPLQSHRKDIPKAFAEAVHKALATKPENRFSTLAEFTTALASKRGGASLPSLPWPKLGLAAGILVAIIGVGTLVSSGTLNVAGLKNLLPQSQEEISQQKAQVAKVQGEIKVLKQRLDNGRRQLDSDVRDAERNKDKNLITLTQWQALTERVIFEGNFITELEGELSMAESLLRENALEQAQVNRYQHSRQLLPRYEKNGKANRTAKPGQYPKAQKRFIKKHNSMRRMVNCTVPSRCSNGWKRAIRLCWQPMMILAASTTNSARRKPAGKN